MANQQQNGNDDNNTFWICLGFVALLIIIWFMGRENIIRFCLSIYRWIFLLVDGFGNFTVFLNENFLNLGLIYNTDYEKYHLMLIDKVMENPEIIDFNGFMTILSHGGEYLSWPLVFPLLYFAWKVHKNPIKTFQEKMTVTRFLERQSKIWKPIVPILHLDLIKKPPKEWRDPYTAAEVAKANKLIFNKVLNPERTKQYLIEQLGKPLNIKDFSNFDNNEKTLFTIFALRIIRERKGKELSAQILLDKLNESCRGTGIPDYNLIKDDFERLKKEPKVLEIIKAHNYIRTALVEMLCCARKLDGVLPPSNFIWLRPLDITLFLALNRAPIVPERLHTPSFVEAAGVLAQWQAEKMAFKNHSKLNQVYVEQAIDAIEEDLVISDLCIPQRKLKLEKNTDEK